MVQPPLDQHYVVMHLGGAKHVTRRRDGPPVAVAVDSGSLTIVPAGTAYWWRTEGPIAFAHLYISPTRLGGVFCHEFDVEDREAAIADQVGCRDPLLESLMAAMLAEIDAAPTASTLRLDALFESFCIQLVHRHASRGLSRDSRPVALAPHRLRRVLEFIEAHLASDLSLADLTAAAGSSQSHFCRAFRLSTHASPYRYLLRRRIERAKILLLTDEMPLESVARACGFQRKHQFATIFRRTAGIGPKRFRLRHRSDPSRGAATTG